MNIRLTIMADIKYIVIKIVNFYILFQDTFSWQYMCMRV